MIIVLLLLIIILVPILMYILNINLQISYTHLMSYFLAETSQENVAVSQPQRQTPPVQQSPIPQNMYNGQSQGTMNQHNAYSVGQIPPPQGLYYLY